MESRSPGACATATGPDVRMQPDKASAVTMAKIGNRNARATRTGAIPHSETAPVLHRLWLTNRFSRGCVDEVRTFCARDVFLTLPWRGRVDATRRCEASSGE